MSALPHKDALTLLMPLQLGGVYSSDTAIEGARLDEARIEAEWLLGEMFPDSTAMLLPDWERVAGLPDPCTGPLSTLEARRAALVARLADNGGQSISFYVALAASLGYQVTIEEFTAEDHPAEPDYGGDWVYVWRVNAPPVSIRNFRAGAATAGERLRTWGNTLLECAFQRRKHAHTLLLFAYGAEDHVLRDEAKYSIDDEAGEAITGG